MSFVDYLWLVPSTKSLKNEYYLDLSIDFSFVRLEQNFRNSQQIVDATKSVAEEKDYKYKEGIVMPPGNFPGGCEPIFTKRFEDAVKEARKRTNEEILVIVPVEIDVNDYFDVLNQLNENGKAFHERKNDFEDGENPYKFLQEGNVLIIDETVSLGFEWSTVIVIEQENNDETYHDCNYMLRCTTNLIVVKEEENDV